MKTNTISITIQYAGMTLQVIKHEGQDYVPLKPLSDLFGLRWENQRKKVADSEYRRRFLGVCTLPRGGAGSQIREETCILLSRVAAFLMSINPEQVRVQGKPTEADFLEKKVEEWADAIHDYEELGIAINLNHVKAQEALRKQRASFAQMIGTKAKTADLSDRRALGHVVKQMAGELGIPYQGDILDE